MDPRAKHADEALERFRASRTPEGRFLSYCRGRSKFFWTRQAVILVLFPVIFLLGGFQTAVLISMVAVTGDAIDSYVLRRISRRNTEPDRLPLAISLTSLTAGLQAATYVFLILAMFRLGDSDLRVLAGAAGVVSSHTR